MHALMKNPSSSSTPTPDTLAFDALLEVVHEVIRDLGSEITAPASILDVETRAHLVRAHAKLVHARRASSEAA